MQKIIDQISHEMSKSVVIEGDEIYFTNSRYKAIPFNVDKFHHARKISSGSRLCFIDGGNSEIISRPNLSVSFIRLHCTIYRNFDKTDGITTEFFSLTNIQEGSFQTRIYQFREKAGIPNEKNLTFKIDDESLKQGVFNTECSRIGNLARRFGELKLAADLIKEKLESGDIIVLDGTLQKTVTNEDIYLDNLFDIGLKKNVLISALTKNSSLITKNGNTPSSVLESLSKERDDIWYYYPSAEINDKNHPAELYFLKLHPKSKFIFRFEIYNKQKTVDADKVIGYLALNSQDPVFLGYPYGLVDADSFARVTEEETKYLALRFKSMDKNAHSILDSIKF